MTVPQINTRRHISILLLLTFAASPSYSAEPTTIKTKLTSSCDNRGPEINNKGDMVWWAFCKGENHIFLLRGGKAQKLTKDGVTGQNPHINSNGTIVWQGIEKNSTRIFTYKDEKIDTLAHEGTKTYAAPLVNDRGDIVWQGVIEDKDEKGRPRIANAIFLFDGKNIKRLETKTHIAMTPDVNDNGTIVFQGWVDKADPDTKKIAPGYTGVFEIFALDQSGIKRITDSGTYMDNQMPRINDNGMIAWTGVGENKNNEIFLYDGNEIRRLTKNDRDDRAPRINNKGDVVWYGYDRWHWQIFHYDGRSTTQLTKSDYDNIEPYINDDRDVVWAAKSGKYYQLRRMRLKQ